MKPLLVLIVVSGTVLAQSSTKHPSGEINGTVVDQSGAPVASATLYAVPQGLGLDDATPRSVKADSNGVFDFHGGFELRSYKLYARKDADGYLDPLDSFYADSDSAPAEVALSSKHPASTVTVKLGKQAAVISGKIIDANSGAPLKASLGLLDAEGHGHSTIVDGDYRVSVPSEKEVTLVVTLPGRDRSLVPTAPLRLQPGQRVYLDIPISTAEN